MKLDFICLINGTKVVYKMNVYREV